MTPKTMIVFHSLTSEQHEPMFFSVPHFRQSVGDLDIGGSRRGAQYLSVIFRPFQNTTLDSQVRDSLFSLFFQFEKLEGFMEPLILGLGFLRKIRKPLFCVVPLTSLLFTMAQVTVAEFRRTLMALAEALSEPGRRFTPDQVMQKGHELNPGQYGTLSLTPNYASLMVSCSLCVIGRPSFIYE